MNKTTWLVVILGAVAVGLILVFTNRSQAGTGAPGYLTNVHPGSPSVQPLGGIASPGVLPAAISAFSGAITSIFNRPPNASVDSSGVLVAPGSVGNTAGNNSSLAAALGAPLSQPIQQLTPQNLMDEYSTPVSPPSTVGWDSNAGDLVTPIPDTGSALDSPGLPGDVVSSF